MVLLRIEDLTQNLYKKEKKKKKLSEEWGINQKLFPKIFFV